MGLIPSIFRGRKPELRSETLVGLTPSGRALADEESEPGLRYDILVSLSQSEKTLGDLARDINETTDTTKDTLVKMRGSVRFQPMD